jgi:hypothetical protein
MMDRASMRAPMTHIQTGIFDFGVDEDDGASDCLRVAVQPRSLGPAANGGLPTGWRLAVHARPFQ